MEQKICYSCSDQKFFKSKKIKQSVYHKTHPKLKNVVTYKLNIGKEHKNKYVYYWSAYGKKKSYNKKSSAYKKMCNSGITKVTSKGNVNIHLRTPKSYKVKGKLYPPHIHFIVENNNKSGWRNQTFTIKAKK